MKSTEYYKELFGDDFWGSALLNYVDGKELEVNTEWQGQLLAELFLHKLDTLYRDDKLIDGYEYEVMVTTFQDMINWIKPQLKGV